MRPLRLKMLNFGPYKDEAVDFTQFENVPLFLISGKTGSGKTTIFDGLCYALFGETSGNERTPQQMRSLFAGNRDKTIVQLTFEHQGKIYQITREPQYSYTNSKGGTSLHQAKQLLEYNNVNGEPDILSKKKDIQAFIEDLLHLNAKQFTQIVLLPQQQFRKFLSADSSEKETVLRQVFGTEIFEKWTNQIKSHVSQLQQQNDQRLASLKTIMKTALLDDELSKKAPTVNDWLAAVDKKIEVSHKLVNDQQALMKTKEGELKRQRELLLQAQQLQTAFEEQQRLKKEQQELARQEPKIIQNKSLIQQLEWAQKQQSLLAQLTQQRADVAKIKQQTKDTDHNLLLLAKQSRRQQRVCAELKGQELSITQLKTQIQQLEPQLDLYTKIQENQEQLRDEQSQLDQTTQDCHQLNKTIQQKNEALSQIQKRLQEIGDLTDANARLLHLKLRLNQLEERNERLNQTQDNFKLVSKQLSKTQQVYIEKKTLTQQLAEEAAKLQNYYAQNQINFYVKQLTPGTACPVCGSKEHPHPFEIQVPENMRAIDENDVRQAQTKYTDAARQLAKVEEQVKTLRQKQQELQHKMDAIVDAIEHDDQINLDNNDLPTLLKKMKHQFNHQQSAFDNLKAEQLKLNKQNSQLTQDIQHVQQDLNIQQQKKIQNEQVITTINTQIEMQRQLLPHGFSTRSELSLQLDKWKKQIQEFEDVKRQNDDIIQQISNKQIVFQTQKKQLCERLDKLQQRLEVNNRELNDRLSKEKSTELELRRLISRLSHLDSLRKEVSDFYQKQRSNRDQLSKIETVIGGRTKPKIKTLQQIVMEQDSQLQQLQIRLGQKISDLKNLESVKCQALKVWQKCQKEQTHLDEITELSQVISGKTKENKLGFERFVLREYFQEVLAVANQVLDRITMGRYSFVLQKTAEKNTAKQTGLGIDVYDDEAGKVRSAHTLSGGESFIAALSLALALGEVIQRQNGGTEIDTLFIDEGFGSLDEDSLEMAMETLRTLKSDHRMIGIISHVQELHSQIPDQINVVSNNGQSRLQYRHEL